IPLSAGDSCRLVSINLKHLVKNPFKEDCQFDYEMFEKVVRSGMRLNDDLVDLELEKLLEIKDVCDTEDEKALWQKLYEACENGRRTGLGTHGLADMLSRMRLKYDSDESIEFIEDLYNKFKNIAYDESANLSQERGSFPVFDWDIEKE